MPRTETHVTIVKDGSREESNHRSWNKAIQYTNSEYPNAVLIKYGDKVAVYWSEQHEIVIILRLIYQCGKL